MVIDRMKKAYQAAKIILFAEDHAEKFTCSVCGKQYISRGKYDPGNLCRDCEAEKYANLIGGPFDSGKVSK